MNSPHYAEHGHLGGYIIGGDSATMCTELWEWLVHEQDVQSVIDVGCGEGWALRYFERMGCDVFGVDGVRQEHPKIGWHDYTTGPFVRRRLLDPDPEDGLVHAEPVQYDLCWSCEFVEHVEERFMPNFLATFKQAPLVLMTHADPGQPGYHHVNCQPYTYWVGAMAAIGYSLDLALTQTTRDLAPGTHYERSGLAFRTSGSRETMPAERS